MARYPRFEPLYNDFQNFKELCLLSGRSLFWPEKNIWTEANLFEFKERFISEGFPGKDLSFHEKLELQLEGADPDLWGLVADLFFIYCLPSSYMKFNTKYEFMENAARKAGLTIPTKEEDFWESQKIGISRTGLKYHYKFAQFAMVVLLALEIRRSSNPKQMFIDYSLLQETLDRIINEFPFSRHRPYDMRHALLYLSFPERYEPSISTRDKELIVENYKEDLNLGEVGDLDKAIYQIREVMEKRYSVEEDEIFDFYWHAKSDWRQEEETTRSPEPTDIVESEPHLPREKDVDLLRVQEVLKFTKNAIIYGPPGTGKTYIAEKAAEEIITKQLRQAPTEAIKIQRSVEKITFYDVLALGIYLEGKDETFSVPEIEQMKIVQGKLAQSTAKFPKNYIWGSLQSHTSPESETVKAARRSTPYIFDKDDASCWMLTGAGQEYVRENLLDPLAALQERQPEQTQLKDFIEWVTFHQSFAYEDFVEGLRPKVSEDDPGSISYEIVPGAFRRICARAANDPENQYVLIIDEINRGNIAKILGELITLLEDDKRNKLTVRLPYSGDDFSVPDNLFVIATMNTADRSIALLDVALRRRFAFVELMPRTDLLAGIYVEAENTQTQLDAVLDRLNEEISRHIDRDHQIGHSYFIKIGEADREKRIDLLDFAWNNQIMPLLEEYFYSQRDKLAEILKDFITPEEVEAEGQEIQNLPIGHLSGVDLVYALSLWVKE